jgi:WD40 repeat protein
MDAETGVSRCVIKGNSDVDKGFVISPSGDQIASRGSDFTTVRLWDVETGASRHTLKGHTAGVMVVAYSPRGDQIASGDSSRTLIEVMGCSNWGMSAYLDRPYQRSDKHRVFDYGKPNRLQQL